MSEQQIQDGFDRLQGALAPPADVADRVAGAIRRRRRRRRTALAGVGVLVVAGTVGGAALLASGDDPDGDVVATDTSDQQGGSFTLTRADGSTIVIDDLTLSCDGVAAAGGGEPGHIYLSSPFELDGSEDHLTKPFFFLDAVVAKVDGRDLVLPVESSNGDSERNPLVLFAADAGDQDANEVSSAEPGAGGTIRVLRASCDPTPVLEVEVEATLGSEVEQGAWKVEGRFRQD